MKVTVLKKDAEKPYLVIKKVIEFKDNEKSYVIYTNEGKGGNKYIFSKPEYECYANDD